MRIIIKLASIERTSWNIDNNKPNRLQIKAKTYNREILRKKFTRRNAELSKLLRIFLNIKLTRSESSDRNPSHGGS